MILHLTHIIYNWQKEPMNGNREVTNMKKRFTFLILLVVSIIMSTMVIYADTSTDYDEHIYAKHKPILKIDEFSFQNEMVRRTVTEYCDMNKDGYLSQYEMDYVTYLDVDVAYMQETDAYKYGKQVYQDEKYRVIDFKGIEVFKNIKLIYFSCALVNGERGYVKNFKYLSTLKIESIGIAFSDKNYNLNQLKGLKYIGFEGCKNFNLKFDKKSKIEGISLKYCKGKVDVSNLKNLKTFSSYETIFKKIKFGKNAKLKKLSIDGSADCINKKIRKLDISKMKNLRYLYLQSCTKLKEIKMSKKNNKKLKKIEIYGCGKFKKSSLDKTQISKKTKVRVLTW